MTMTSSDSVKGTEQTSNINPPLNLQVKVLQAQDTENPNSLGDEQNLPKTKDPNPESPGPNPNTIDSKLNNDPKCVGVIFTISQSSSYDPLFQRVKQDTPDGEVVSIYEVESAFVPYLHDALSQSPGSDNGGEITPQFPLITEIGNNRAMNCVLAKAAAEVADLEPESVVINFECCGNCSSKGFSQPRSHTHCHSNPDPSLAFIAMCIKKGFLVMVSDFSLKALISTWKSELPVLGHNPFVKLGEFSQSFELRFNPETLKESCSAQLKILAEMSDDNRVKVHAMGGTILYGVNAKNAKKSGYSLEVLTVMSNYAQNYSNPSLSDLPQKFLVEDAARNKGAAGHVALTYPSGGIILASAGHWIELSEVKTSEESFFRVMDQEYGVSSARNQQLKSEYASLPVSEKSEWLQRNCMQQVQSRSAAVYSKKKSAWGKK